MPSAFISHSSIDKPFVRRLKDDLEDSGVSAWLDEDQILPGQSFVARINQGLEDNDFVLLVISANFLSSDWALWETNTSIVSAVKAKADSVIPRLLDNVWDAVPALLRDKVYIDFRNAGNVAEYRYPSAAWLLCFTDAKRLLFSKRKHPLFSSRGDGTQGTTLPHFK
jgi:hypothetical protein